MEVFCIGFFGAIIAFMFQDQITNWRNKPSKAESDAHDRMMQEYEREQEAWSNKHAQFVIDVISEHIDMLVKKRHNLVHKNDYGVEDLTPMKKEAEYFVENVMIPAHSKWMNGLTAMELYEISEIEQEHKPQWRKLMAQQVSEFVENTYGNPESRRRIEEAYSQDEEVPDDPLEYEHYVARVMKKDGWDARATQGSGDQGADVIAEKDGYKVIVQCKKYKGSVGNKAVQEVFAAKKFFNGTHGVVVNSSGQFTKSARALAAKNGIELMHHNDLRSWEPD